MIIAHLQPDFSVCGNLSKKYSSCSSSWLTMILITWKITATFFWLKCAFIRKSLSSKVVENADFFLWSIKSFVKYSAVFSEKSPYWINAFSKISGFTFWSHSDAVWIVFQTAFHSKRAVDFAKVFALLRRYAGSLKPCWHACPSQQNAAWTRVQTAFCTSLDFQQVVACIKPRACLSEHIPPTNHAKFGIRV